MSTEKTTVQASSLTAPAPVANPIAPDEVTSVPPQAAASAVVYIKAPPPISAIPTVPEGYTNAAGIDYRGSLPKKLEQSAMPDVLEELARFTEYASVFGKTAPPLPYVLQTLTAAGQWTAMRMKLEAWDEFSRTQESAAWSDARVIFKQLRPAFALAVATDATLARQFPGLVRLFEAKTVIARRSAESRRVNAKDLAAGRPPSRGKAARAANRAAKLIAAAQAKAPVAPAADPPEARP